MKPVHEDYTNLPFTLTSTVFATQGEQISIAIGRTQTYQKSAIKTPYSRDEGQRRTCPEEAHKLTRRHNRIHKPDEHAGTHTCKGRCRKQNTQVNKSRQGTPPDAIVPRANAAVEPELL